MVEGRYVKNMRIGTLALAILLIFGLVSSSNVCALDGEALGGECSICGEWVAAGEQHSCWEQAAPQSEPGGYDTWQWQPPVPSGPSPQELERQRRRQQAYDLNEEANRFYEKRDFAKAAELYQKALSIDPDRPVISENLRKAEVWLQQQREAEARELEKKRKIKEAEDRVHGMLDNLSFDFDGSRGRASTLDEKSSSALDFIGAKDPLFSKETKASTPPDLQFMEEGAPSIVDPRVVKGEMTAEEARKVRTEEAERDLKAFASVASAIASVAEGDYESGINHLKKALEIKPGAVEIQKQLGYVYYLRDQQKIKRSANPKVDALLDALEAGQGNWITSMDYLQAVYQGDSSQTAHRDAYFFLQGLSGYYAGPLESTKDKAPPLIDDTLKQSLVNTIVEAGRLIKEEKDPEKAYTILEEARNAHSDVQPVSDLLHFSEGLVAAKNTEEITRTPKAFDPTDDDSAYLIEVVQKIPERSFREIVVEQLEQFEQSLAGYLHNR